MSTSTETASGTGAGTPPGPVRADCLADAEGGIVFRVRGTAAADAGALVLRRRGGGPGEELRLPLTEAAGGVLRAELPASAATSEGRWTVTTDTGRVVEPGLRDLRAVVDRTPGPGPLTVRVPYPGAGGRLVIRCWLRTAHAEAGPLDVSPGGTLSVTGRLHGTALGPGARAEARTPGADGAERVHRVSVTGEGGTFAFTLPYAPLAEAGTGEERTWELWLRPGAGADELRIARILDDVWDKREIFRFPEHRTPAWHAVPCYTADNELGIRLTPRP